MPHLKRNVALLSIGQALRASQASLLLSVAALASLQVAEPSLSTLPLSILFASTLVATVPTAWGMRRFGAKPTYLVTAVFGAIGGAVGALGLYAGSFGLLCAGSGLVGIYNCAGNYFRFTAADIAPVEHKSSALSWVLAGGVLAAFVGPNLGRATQKVGTAPEFLFSFVAVAGLGVLGFFALSGLVLPASSSRKEKHPGRSLREIASQPLYRLAVLGGTLGFAIMSLLMTATPLAMKEHHHPFSDTATVIQWHVFAMFAPSFFTGSIIARFGATRVMLTGVFLDAACVALNLSGHTFVHYWGALFCLGLGWNFLFLGATSLLTQTYRPEEKEKAQALNDLFVNGGTVLASLLAGALHHQVGWRTTNWVVVPALLILVLALAKRAWRSFPGLAST